MTEKSSEQSTGAVANREAWRGWNSVMFKHWKRGNWHHWPQPVLAWRAAMATRWICLGCPIDRAPRFLQRMRHYSDKSTSYTKVAIPHRIRFFPLKMFLYGIFLPLFNSSIT